MPATQCRTCTASITWAELRDGTKIPLDDHEEVMSGENRYRIIAFRGEDPPLAEAVSANYQARALVDHREICQQPRRM